MSDWRDVRLGDATVSLDARRKPVKASDRVAGPYPYYGASGVVDYVDSWLFDETTLLVSEDGENLRTRKTPIAFLASGRYWVNNHAHVLKAAVGYDLRFLCYAIQMTDIVGYLTGSTQPKLTAANLAKVRLTAPEYAEQRRIAAVLGALDDLIETNRGLIALLWDCAELAYHRVAVSSKVSILGEHVRLLYGKALPARDRTMGPFPVVSSAGIVDWHDSPLVSGPGVVVGRKGTAGSVTWVFEDFFPIDTAFYVETNLPILWAYFVLREAGLSEMNTDSAVPGLNRENASRRSMRLPTAELLDSFAAETSAYLNAIRGLTEEVDDLTRTRDELLPLLMSGKVRVSEDLAVV